MKTTVSRKLAWLVAAALALAAAWAIFASGHSGWGSISASDEERASASATRYENGIRIHTVMGAARIQALETGSLTVQLTDADGAPLSGVKLAMTMDMVGMHHPLPKAELAETSPGLYKGEFVPVMAGKWIAKITAEGQGIDFTYTHSFDVIR